MTREYLIEDIKRLSNDDVHKLYRYIRRHMIAKIEGLPDPLERDEVYHLELVLKNLIKEYADLLYDAETTYEHYINLPSKAHYFRDENKLLKKLQEEYMK